MSAPNRYAYIVPMHEGNSDKEDLAYWTERGELFRAYLMDDSGQYDADNFKTRAEAYQSLKNDAAALGWDWADVQFSVDE